MPPSRSARHNAWPPRWCSSSTHQTNCSPPGGPNIGPKKETTSSSPNHQGVSKNRGKPPKSSILIGFSMKQTIHLGVPLFLGNTHQVSGGYVKFFGGAYIWFEKIGEGDAKMPIWKYWGKNMFNNSMMFQGPYYCLGDDNLSNSRRCIGGEVHCCQYIYILYI